MLPLTFHRSIAGLAFLVPLVACDGDRRPPTESPTPSVAVVRVIGGASLLEVGEATAFRAVLLSSSGDTLNAVPVEWRTSDVGVASVTTSGIVTGVGAGTVDIIAIAQGKEGAQATTVTIAPVRAVTFIPAADTVLPGNSTQFTAVLRDARDGVLTGRPVVWSSSDPTVATIDASGKVTAMGNGAATIRATVEGTVYATSYVVLRTFTEIVPGGVSSCGLTANGETWCWGSNRYGNLGTGNFLSSPLPVRVPGSLRFERLFIGGVEGATCGLTAEALAYCWGSNAFGAIGDGAGGVFSTASDRNVPTPVAGGHRFAELSLGYFRSCGVDLDGIGYCWGAPMGADILAVPPVTVPAIVPSPVPLKSIVLGRWRQDAFACALSTTDRAYCWGSNRVGTLGTGDRLDRAAPTPVAGDLTFTALALGDFHACGLTPAGKVYCWGSTDYGVSGGPVFGPPKLVPTALGGNAPPLVSLTAGDLHTCGLTAAGEAWCWGSGIGGALGPTVAVTAEIPVPFPGLRFRTLRATAFATCGIATNTMAYCWGENSPVGRLGLRAKALAETESMGLPPGRVVFK